MPEMIWILYTLCSVPQYSTTVENEVFMLYDLSFEASQALSRSIRDKDVLTAVIPLDSIKGRECT